MLAATDSIVAPLPSGMATESMRVAFEHFGEVASIRRIPKFNGCVQVEFYDVRAAARALKAFGEAGCAPGPECGDRFVRLAGDAELSMKDFKQIKEVSKGADAGCFILEFYDRRDAMKYRDSKALETPGLKTTTGPSKKDLPPGLLPPPGLEASLPDESEQTAASSEWQVIITGLPGKLLSEAMLEAVFQQAGLSCHSGFSVGGAKSSNEFVTVRFSSMLDAQRCVAHFQGCQWDKSGEAVATEVIPPADGPKLCSASTRSEECQKGMSADAPVFQPVAGFSGLSAQAPAFVPSEPCSSVDLKEPAVELGEERRCSKTGSDTSTEVGESEDDEKCCNPKEITAAWTPSLWSTRTRPRTSSSSSS
eukprot:TRINITY_DN3537_c0_g1_i2.p1 TRINITY_DN3537_c0_g1~~TRINITY_DN3537_c0_g1_i2.p1  ORF type:complete len:364 (-),score=78.85 TRINITY_DN3537_c0_g1_i2:229-1320(-)